MTAPVAAQSTPGGPARTVVVTGVAKKGQFGETLARSFARGDRIAIIARSATDAAARAAELRADGIDARPFACDLADPRATKALAASVLADVGPADALINVAGGFAFSGPVSDADPGEMIRQFTINAVTAFNATQAFLPALRTTSGAIVFVASSAALPGARVRNVSAYAMAKSAVVTLMRAVAQEEHESGVRANAVAPGSIRTTANLAAMPAGTKYVEPEAVAAVIRYLCSPEATGVTGQLIEIAP